MSQYIGLTKNTMRAILSKVHGIGLESSRLGLEVFPCDHVHP